MDHLDYQTNHRTSVMTAVAAQFAGQMAVRLVHDHLLSLDVSRYSGILSKAVVKVYRRINQLLQVRLRLFLIFAASIYYSKHLGILSSRLLI